MNEIDSCDLFISFLYAQNFSWIFFLHCIVLQIFWTYRFEFLWKSLDYRMSHLLSEKRAINCLKRLKHMKPKQNNKIYTLTIIIIIINGCIRGNVTLFHLLYFFILQNNFGFTSLLRFSFYVRIEMWSFKISISRIVPYTPHFIIFSLSLFILLFTFWYTFHCIFFCCYYYLVVAGSCRNDEIPCNDGDNLPHKQ